MTDFFSLPKPFEPLCDYEESDSESENEESTEQQKSTTQSTVQSSDDVSEIDNAEASLAEQNVSKKEDENTTAMSDKEEDEDSDDDQSDNDDITEEPCENSGTHSLQNVSNAQQTELKGQSGSASFSKKSYFQLKAKEIQTSSKVAAVPNSSLEIRDKLRQLEMMKNSARKLNHEAVVEEDRVKRQPANWQALQKKNDWLLYEDERKKECLVEGKEWDRVKLLSMQADEAARLDSRKRRKNPDTGFASFEQASYRQYDRLTRQMTVDQSEYTAHKQEVGEESQNVNSMYHGTHKPSEANVERMVGDLEKQVAKRAKFSRRRTFIEDRDVDYINERNAKFNKKIERFYGEYTAEIKQNLERGTAI